MLGRLNLLPSRSSRAVLLPVVGVASFICFWVLSADVDCGIQRLICGALFGVAGIALVAGLGFGALLTAVLVLLSFAVSCVYKGAKVLESGYRAWPVSGILIALHFAAFCFLNLLGTLPIGWEWWHGAFGILASLRDGPVIYVGP
jgi:hypothetical protein